MLSGSVSEAARILQVSQPAVSVVLRRIEDQMGVALFVREKGGITPTREALALYPDVERLFGTFELVQSKAMDISVANSGVISVAATPTIAQTFVARAVARFRARRPGARVHLEVTHTRLAAELTRDGRVDIGIIPSWTTFPKLRSETLIESGLGCLLRRDHPLSSRKTLAPRDLDAHPLIVKVNDISSTQTQEAFRKHGIERDHAIACNMTTTAAMLVEAGAGIAIVEPWIDMAKHPDLAFRPFVPKIKIGVAAVLSAEGNVPKLVAEFLQVIRQEIGESAPAYLA